MAKKALEDWRRKKQDIEMNNRKVKVHSGDGLFDHTRWMNLKVGDIVKVEKDEFFPADLILLSSRVTDPLKRKEVVVIEGLCKMGVKLVMVTGDNWRTTQAVAKEIGIEDVKAKVMPVGKVDVIRSFQKDGSTMVAEDFEFLISHHCRFREQ
ncbi:hypothetical protein K2173_027408 [Erythroxylum novogranatense]|uniref:P-type ATPase n=1 Tax=Erythroxylum novogranatense TaxID=1862640 RepID=A0AAV8U0C2_9ROSI|nr:hypothetical protein K2173_027408 [Erythroxylum novogranatense]